MSTVRHLRCSKAIAAVVAAAVLGTTGFVLAPGADADSPAVESVLLQKINEGRAAIGKPSLVAHSGLRDKQRGHAAYMSSIDQLTHAGFGERHDTATPDPAESNGAPDDGFSGSAAENVAYRTRSGQTDAQVAEGLYMQWFNSPGHKSNMFDESNAGYNVAGLGIFEASNGEVWAALLLAQDATTPSRLTPPDGGSALDTIITSGPTRRTKDRTPDFTFTSNETGVRFEASIDGGAYGPASSPYTLPKLTLGSHRFDVRAINEAGNTDSTPATASFQVKKKARR